MTKQKLNNTNRLNANTVSVDGLTIGELDPVSTSQIKDTDLLATETDLSTNSISVGQIKEVVGNSMLSKTNNQLGTVLFHPAPAGYQGIPAETNGFGDAILVADGRQLDKTAYIDLWNFIVTRKNKSIYGFNGETAKSFKIDELTNKITLPNLLSGDALYMGNYGLQNAIFPQHTFTSGSIQPTTAPHQHNYTDVYRDNNSGSDYQGDGSYQHRRTTATKSTTNSTVIINPFTVTSSSISNLPAGITLGTDLKVAGVKMIPCIVCKPTYNINADGGSGGGVTTQDLDMNLFKIINVGSPISPSDATRLIDLTLETNSIKWRWKGSNSNNPNYENLQTVIDDLYIDNIYLMDAFPLLEQQVRDNENALYVIQDSYLQLDRSVNLVGAGEFNSKQVASMDDLKDSNIIVGDSVRVITTLDSKLNQIDTNIINLQSSIPTFKVAQSRRLVKPNTNIIEIAGQGRLFPIDSFIPTTATGYETDTFTIETFNGKKVIKEKMENGIVTRHLNIRLSLGHTASMTSKKIELAVYLFRGSQTGLDDNSAIATGSSMLFYDTDARGQSTNLLSVVVNGVNDAFVTEGWFIVLKSLNPSADKLIFSKGDILINIVNSN